MQALHPVGLGLLVGLTTSACSNAPKHEEPSPSGQDSAAPSDEGVAIDNDGDGVPLPEDCNDADPSVFPGAPERCDGADQDCDSIVDEDATDAQLWWLDRDGDTVGEIGDSLLQCPGPETIGYAARTGDCDDANAAVFPGAAEHCDGIDEDCDGETDEDAVDLTRWWADGDGDGRGAGSPMESCEVPPNGVLLAGDCDDADPARSPGFAEDCDPRGGIDEDCDGLVDCEDADCSALPECEEADCTDGLDSDFDGLTDCLDDDCWSEPSCKASSITIHGGHVAHRTIRGSGTSDERWSASGVSGSARRPGPSGGTSTCRFSMAHAVASASMVSPQLGPVDRSMTLSSGCAFDPRASLPPVLGRWSAPGTHFMWGFWRATSAPWSPSGTFSASAKVGVPLYAGRTLAGSGTSTIGASSSSGHGSTTIEHWRTYTLGGSVLAFPPAAHTTTWNSWW